MFVSVRVRPGSMRHTQVLDVLVGEETDDAAGHLGSRLCAGALCLVNDNAVGEGGGDERGAVRELGHTAVVVQAQPRQAVAERGENERHVPIVVRSALSLLSCVLVAACGQSSGGGDSDGATVRDSRDGAEKTTYPINQATATGKSQRSVRQAAEEAPRTLQGLSHGQEPLLEGQVGVWRRSHLERVLAGGEGERRRGCLGASEVMVVLYRGGSGSCSEAAEERDEVVVMLRWCW